MATPLNSGFIGPTPAGGAGGTPDPHAASHENGGADEISVDGLSGLLADAQTPLAHNQSASTITTGTLAHERGGLEADVSAYSGLVKISGGATSQATAGTDYAALFPMYVVPYSATFDDYYLGNSLSSTGGSTTALVADRFYAAPWICPWNVSVVRDLTVRVTTGVAATQVRFGLYTSNATTLLPDQLVANTDSGDKSSATSGSSLVHTPGATVTLTKGNLYWAVIISDGAPTIRWAANYSHIMQSAIPVGASQANTSYAAASTYGALPSTAPTVNLPQTLNFGVPFGVRFTS